ncbi:MAG: ATP synthase F1 subunit delta [Clostridia bacterium]|nr:ATP synthase F1 subunit delta [Clostridia bacterium]
MTQISKEYANALFSVAVEQGKVRAWADELQKAVKLFADQPAYLSLLASPEVSGEERAELLEKSLGGLVSPEVLNLLRLITVRGRARLIPDVAERYGQLADESERRKTARIVSAVPLTDAEKERLRRDLEKRTQATVELICEVDPSLLGGMVMEIDGRVVDGTLRARLREIEDVISR